MLKPGKHSLSYFTIFHYITLCVLWGFVICHAFTMFITNDEAYSFFLMKTNYLKAMVGTANTHWLNSIFMKIFNLVFGNDIGYMRIQSIIVFPFFAIGVFKLSHFIQNIFLQIAFYCLVLFNPYILDYFSLARGYALALTFQVWMIIFFLEATSSKEFIYKKWLAVFVCGLLSIASNFSYLYSFLGVAGCFSYLLITSQEYSLKIKNVKSILLLFLVLITSTIAALLVIKYYGHDLDYGGDTYLILSLINSVWRGSLYFASSSYLADTIGYVSFILLLGSIIYFWLASIKQSHFSKPLIISIPVIAIILLNIVFHILFKTPFLLFRTAIQWFPVGVLLIILFFDTVTTKIKINKCIQLLFCCIFSLLIIIHFIRQSNIHYCYENEVLVESRNSLEDLSNCHPKNAAVPIYFLGVYTNYYKIIDSNLAKVPLKIIREDELLNYSSAQLKSYLKFDYMIASLALLERMKQAGISFKIVKGYQLSTDKLIRINSAPEAQICGVDNVCCVSVPKF